MAPPIHGVPVALAIPVKDTARASAFYSAVFDWTFGPEPNVNAPVEFLMVFQVPGDSFQGGIIRKVSDEEFATVPGTVAYIYVDDMEAAMDRIVKNGGKQVSEKEAEGTKGWYQSFEDTEGNAQAIYSLQK